MTQVDVELVQRLWPHPRSVELKIFFSFGSDQEASVVSVDFAKILAKRTISVTPLSMLHLTNRCGGVGYEHSAHKSLIDTVIQSEQTGRSSIKVNKNREVRV